MQPRGGGGSELREAKSIERIAADATPGHHTLHYMHRARRTRAHEANRTRKIAIALLSHIYIPSVSSFFYFLFFFSFYMMPLLSAWRMSEASLSIHARKRLAGLFRNIFIVYKKNSISSVKLPHEKVYITIICAIFV